MSQLTVSQDSPPAARKPRRSSGAILDHLFRVATVVLAAFVMGGLLFVIARSAVYKIHEYERGLHLRGGRFISVEEPGWHVQIPLVDTVIIVTVNERLGYAERVPAMTSDDVTMDVSLQYTYRVVDPKIFALQVRDSERIIFEFVQGKLRDVVNNKDMTEVMHRRAEVTQEVMAALGEREAQYGVEFVTVQIQAVSPPEEVVAAIKDRMVAVQREEQAQAEAAQRRILADADFYAAQKKAEGDAYEITKLAQADAERIALTSQAEQISVQAMLDELQRHDELGTAYIQLLIAEALKDNSKWVISGGQSGESLVPRVELPATP